MIFTKIHEQLGFPFLVPSSARGFDIDLIEYKGLSVTVEFEYKSSNYILHGHQNAMLENRRYVVICWEDDCGLITRLKEEYGVELYELIEIRNYVKVVPKYELENIEEEPLYFIMSYRPSAAGNKDFGEWVNTNCFTTATSPEHPKFAGDYIPPGSKVLFYQNGYIIGGFTVVRYEVMDEPKTKRERNMYRKLTNYPISLYTMQDDEWWEFSRGHIFFTDFFDTRDFKIKMSNYIDKHMSRHGKINITKEEYYKITGH